MSSNNQREDATQLCMKPTSCLIKAEPKCIDSKGNTDSSIYNNKPETTMMLRKHATRKSEVGIFLPGSEQRRPKKSRVRMPPVTIIEQEYLLGVIEGYLPITEKRKYDSLTSENKDVAWREIAKHFCSVSGFSRRDEHQLRKWWKNMKVRAKKLYLSEKERGGWTGFEDLEKMDLDSMMKKVCALIPDQMLAGPGRTGLPGDVEDDDDLHVCGDDIDEEYDKEDDQYSDDVMQDEEPGHPHPQLSTEMSHFPPEESNPTTNLLPSPSTTAPFHHPPFYQAPPQTVPPPPPVLAFQPPVPPPPTPPVPPAPASRPPNEDTILMIRREHELAIELLRKQIENARKEHALKVSLLERKIELVATQQKQLERQIADSDPILQMARLSTSRGLYTNL